MQLVVMGEENYTLIRISIYYLFRKTWTEKKVQSSSFFRKYSISFSIPGTPYATPWSITPLKSELAPLGLERF